MSDERFEQEPSEDETEDVEAHRKSSQARHTAASDEPGTDESDEVEAHAKKV